MGDRPAEAVVAAEAVAGKATPHFIGGSDSEAGNSLTFYSTLYNIEL